ncbi:MAG: TIM barrel protein [Candidatus Aenigmatarchaeota archaeon]|nr:TIM barrel protein [Candidatus Aenigmarchaeota archaeon]
MKIRIGPAGIPLSAKERTSICGVKTVSELGLNAMEVEFVRGVKMSEKAAIELGKVAKELDVSLSIHAPYFINLTSKDKSKILASHRMIRESAERGVAMEASIVVIHAGYYGLKNSQECTNAMIEEISKLENSFKNIILGLETTGRLSQWGTIDEILEVCKKLKFCVPVIDFAHIYARNGGKIDYSEIFDKIKKFKHIHSHFSSINWTAAGIGKGNEKNHLPISHNKPEFEPLAKEIIKRKLDITIINESPLLEKDALIMKRVFESLGYKF